MVCSFSIPIAIVTNWLTVFLGNFGPGQQAAYTGAQAQSPAAYGGGPMGYSGPPSAGGYGRGQGPNPNNAQQWNQGQAPPQNFGNNGYSGYQG